MSKLLAELSYEPRNKTKNKVALEILKSYDEVALECAL